MQIDAWGKGSVKGSCRTGNLGSRKGSRVFGLPGKRVWSVCLVLGLGGQVVLAQDTKSPAAPQTNRLGLLETVRQTLSLDPNIHLQQREVEASRGRALEASGAFDIRLTSQLDRSLERQGIRVSALDFTHQVAHLTSYRAGVSKLLRTGVEVTPSLKIIQRDERGALIPPENQSEVSFQIRVPLARGFGSKVTTAQERASKIILEVSRLDLRHIVATRVLQTVRAYWAYLSATRRLEILTLSEQRAQELLDKTQALVDANEVPAAELLQLKANLADKTANRIAGQQTLIEARHQLGIAIGIPLERMTVLPSPGDEFPSAAAPPVRDEDSSERFIGEALARRSDLASVRLREDAERIRLLAARNRLKPQIDLIVRGGYAGINAGSRTRDYLSVLGENVEGMTVFGGLSFDFPPANREARGQFLQQEALWQQQGILLADLQRKIQSGVIVAMQQLRHRAEELKKSEEAIAQYMTAVQNEQAKRQLGLATLINVLEMEDRLIGASLGNLSAQEQFAIGLAQLRFETGTLVTGEEPGEVITLQQLITVPPVAKPPGTQ